jgi:hypothetical protein
MRKLPVVLVVALTAALGPAPAGGQDGGGAGILFANQRQFRIPFNPSPGTQNLKQLQLFVSSDQGRTWSPSAIVAPDQRFFRFLAERDGFYWFTVQTLDQQGKLFPATLDNVQPSLKVVVDTQPPNVQLSPLAPRGGEVGVSWDVRDENLDLAVPEALKLEYRLAGSVTWQPLPVGPGVNQFYWNPGASALVEVRLRARDRAGNLGEAAATVSLQGGGQAFANPAANSNHLPSPPPADPGVGAAPDRRLVNSKRVTLNYELKEVGPSGVSFVELWYTMDGRSWNKYPVRFGEDPSQHAITFDVVSEGVYGITLVAKSGVGLGDRPPQVGDRPHLWVEVDTTKPVVQLHNVLVGTGTDKGKLTVTWAARDKNLAREPITLSYAEQPTGPWKTIAEKLKNDGRYVWTMPGEGVPYQFHVRVEAADTAGNVGEAVTDALIKVDLSTPKVRILNVEPASK